MVMDECWNKNAITQPITIITNTYINTVMLCERQRPNIYYLQGTCFQCSDWKRRKVYVEHFSAACLLRKDTIMQLIWKCTLYLTRNSSGDEIANVNFLYDDIIHTLQNTGFLQVFQNKIPWLSQSITQHFPDLYRHKFWYWNCTIRTQ